VIVVQTSLVWTTHQCDKYNTLQVDDLWKRQNKFWELQTDKVYLISKFVGDE